VQRYKKKPKDACFPRKSCNFAAAFRRNRWQEAESGLLCCVGTIQQVKLKKVKVKN
jgi:hypothetical protein